MNKTLLYGATKVDGSTAVSSLDIYQWKSRVLVIFTDTDNTRGSRQENLLLSDREGLQERDLVVLKVTQDNVVAVFGDAGPLEADRLREELEAPESGIFAAILIGKDGSVKLRAVEPVACEELFEIIDGMPMRAAETTRQQDR
ncbi:DUF4174 domain-containing protein [Rhizobium tumorigenes]|uniref:DUF4174 domain-containing protein n=1 Tax=Rhizobium tumorigenes TaxID=2041385 RepID=A0AAF1KUH2_9HYPH|nr:DUF4174 domain-containing protein [Rhizobium tumorigenes]WFR95861.1 DUF4174 domain-containing protein [Rhizobium tumorigenes]